MKGSGFQFQLKEWKQINILKRFGKYAYLSMWNSKCWIFVSRGTIWVANSFRLSSVIFTHLMWNSYFQRKWMSVRLRTNVSLIIEWFLLNHQGFALQIKVSKTSLIGWTKKKFVWFWQFAISRISLKNTNPWISKSRDRGQISKRLSKNHLVSFAMNQEFLSAQRSFEECWKSKNQE